MTDIRAFLKSVKPSGGKIVIKHKFPHSIETAYRQALVEELRKVIIEVKGVIVPLVKQENDRTRNDDKADVIRAVRNISNASFSPGAIASRIAGQLKAQQDKDIARAFEKGVGVNITPPGSDLSKLVDLWVEQNTSVITDLRSDYLKAINNTISNGFRSGLSTRDIADEINRQTGIGIRRAKGIARNEIGNLNASLTEQRDKDLGLDEYIWRNVGDERVRGAPQNGVGGKYPNAVPSHVARGGKKYRYSEPPSGGNPGEDFLCRCYAEAVIEF